MLIKAFEALANFLQEISQHSLEEVYQQMVNCQYLEEDELKNKLLQTVINQKFNKELIINNIKEEAAYGAAVKKEQKMPTKKEYAVFLKGVLESYFPKIQKQINDFLDSDRLDYFNVDSGMTCLNINYVLFKEENDRARLIENLEYLRKIIKVFQKYESFGVKHPKAIINRMFGVANFCKMVRTLKEELLLSESDYQDSYHFTVDLVDWVVNYPEWGAHNRASIRGRGMIEAAKTFPEKPMASRWNEIGFALLSDSIGKWSIEDAATYHPIWLEDVMECLDEEWPSFPNKHVIVQYYLNFFTYITNPLFIATEYGDGRSGTQWGHLVHLFEQGASRYNNGVYKYMANRIFDKMVSMGVLEANKLNQATALVNAYFSCCESIEEEEPYLGSLEVLDDLVTKKIVFKNGLDEKKSTFLFLNYKDESENGILGRRNLDQTIVAPAEKNHHGHCDENSINLLTYKDAILLHDGGYREKIDLKGAFRADFYHNKLIIRDNISQDVWKNIEAEPHYNKVKTEKLYFYTSSQMDISRTRIYDYKHHVFYDRALTYLKELNAFVVVDIVKANKKQRLFLSNQYFTQNADTISTGLFQTYFNSIGTDELKQIPNPNDKKLIIFYPNMKDYGQFYLQDLRRSYTNEKIISKYLIKKFKGNETYASVTVLIPNDNKVDYDLIDSIKVTEAENGISVSLEYENKFYEMTHKYDELKGLNPKRRPMYTFDETKVVYNRVETDALFSGVVEDAKQVNYLFVAASKLEYQNQVLFEIKESDFYQPDISIKYHIGSYNFLASRYVKGVKGEF